MYVGSNIPGPADKEDIIGRKTAVKSYYIWARMQLVTPTNVFNRPLSNIRSKGLKIYVDLKLCGSADKKNIIPSKDCLQKYYICGRNVIERRK